MNHIASYRVCYENCYAQLSGKAWPCICWNLPFLNPGSPTAVTAIIELSTAMSVASKHKEFTITIVCDESTYKLCNHSITIQYRTVCQFAILQLLNIELLGSYQFHMAYKVLFLIWPSHTKFFTYTYYIIIISRLMVVSHTAKGSIINTCYHKNATIMRTYISQPKIHLKV